jgi:hypothetical protein
MHLLSKLKLIYSRGNMHLLDKVKLILLSPCYLVAKSVYVYALHHFIHALHSVCIPYIYLYAHTYRSPGVTLLEFKAVGEEDQQET